MSKDNIMKATDGLFHKLFREIGAEYPEIEQEHMIIDIGAARLAERPERFDVVVTLNLYGDIISDIAAEVSGSVGLAGSANIGDDFAMFEAIHGSAPDIAGQDMANPSGLLHAALMMLAHIGQGSVAERIHNAWLRAIEDGIHTADVFNDSASTARVGTRAFAEAVIARLGQKPLYLPAVHYPAQGKRIVVKPAPTRPADKQLVGVDVFLHWRPRDAKELGEMLREFRTDTMELTLITNRGVKVWPNGHPATFCTDHWRCRFKSAEYKPTDYAAVLSLLSRLNQRGFEIIKTENLYTFDGEAGFTLGQGQ
jgi:isocitrate dehydrogenase